MKEFARLPIPKLKRRVTKRASNTNAHRPRTFAEILVRESFYPEAISRFEALDDKAHGSLPQVRSFCRRDCMKVRWYSDAINAGCCEICDARTCFVQVSKYKISEDGNLSTRQTVRTAADESEVRGYIFRFLEPLSDLAPELGLGEFAMESRTIGVTHHCESVLTQVCSV